VIQHHNEHTHLETEITGESGSFVVEEHADNTFYELCLFAEADPDLRDQTCREIHPEKGSITLASDPVGASITYVDEGLEVLAPYIIHPIVNSTQTVYASPIHADRSFKQWQDGKTDPQRSFVTGPSEATLTAIYENRAPSARLSTSALTGTAPFTVRFDASASTDPEGSLLSYAWDFGNGATDAGPKTQYTFQSAGTFTVQVTATDKLGASSTANVKVTVEAVPTSTPTPAPTSTPAETPTPTPTYTPTIGTSGNGHSEPTATSTPTFTPEPPRLSLRPPIQLSVPKAKRCGGGSHPCVVSTRQAVDAINSLGSTNITSVSGLQLIIEQRTGPRKFSTVVSMLVRTRVGRIAIRSRLPLKLLKTGATYRIAYQTRDTLGRMERLSRYRYIVVRGR
jgi:hypothetical protein